MKVRDKRYKKTDYKGHEVECPSLSCPCRPCFNVHDCGYYLPGKFGEKRWISHFECATWFNRGCSTSSRPKHLFKNTKRFQNRKVGDVFRCIRCGQLCKIGQGEFDFEIID